MKHLHITLAVLSIALFTYRFILTLIESKSLGRKWLKISPHVIDTFLLIAGITLAVKLHLNPMEHMWLAEKILALFAYIFTGYYTLKLARNKPMQILGFLGAMGWVMLIVRLAMTREAMFFS
ncbi:SirB2 family protein [Colwellia psychrerythraea]|uniref:Invasion up-regulator protein SirB n=1 Tax=Colwellia psychrerythraea TaxID=28229 RepID=A0A099L208_COLPS|nr:SirB2 family protein [Colwellia psychrerythraea]KGJ96142.1 Invasion up-regulator protein SirB [Colwellia psychrerythraea]